MTLARMIASRPRPRIKNPTTVGTAICHAGMAATGCMEVGVGQAGRRNERVWRFRQECTIEATKVRSVHPRDSLLS